MNKARWDLQQTLQLNGVIADRMARSYYSMIGFAISAYVNGLPDKQKLKASSSIQCRVIGRAQI